MSKFSGSTAPQRRIDSPIQTTSERVTNAGGQLGYARDAKSELFVLAAANMVGEDSFYEGASERDQRFRNLVRRVSLEDPAWVARFIPYLRNEMQMRTASVVAAAEFAHTRKGAGVGANSDGSVLTVRSVVDSACQRADEPAEFLGYWLSRFGRSMPSAVKRGLGDAAARLYTERNALKYDGTSRAVRMGDVIELAHPKPKAAWQSDLYTWLLDTRHGRSEITIPESLEMLHSRANLEVMPVPRRREWLLGAPDAPGALERSGMTWESLSGWLQGPMDAAAWEAMIPSMGYMALMRNLRNFNQAGISANAKTEVTARLMNAEAVERSRQFPFRFLSAYKAIEGDLEYSYALERALNHSLANVPSLEGRSLILIDWSSSMSDRASGRMSDMSRGEVATLFGVALGLRAASADIVAFGPTGSQYKLEVKPGASLLPIARQWRALGGTDTLQAVERFYRAGYHSRVIIITDEQFTGGGYTGYGYRGYGRQSVDPLTPVPANVPCYTVNLGGYSVAHAEAGTNRYTFAGLTDRSFNLIPVLEAGTGTDWPF